MLKALQENKKATEIIWGAMKDEAEFDFVFSSPAAKRFWDAISHLNPTITYLKKSIRALNMRRDSLGRFTR